MRPATATATGPGVGDTDGLATDRVGGSGRESRHQHNNQYQASVIDNEEGRGTMKRLTRISAAATAVLASVAVGATGLASAAPSQPGLTSPASQPGTTSPAPQAPVSQPGTDAPSAPAGAGGGGRVSQPGTTTAPTDTEPAQTEPDQTEPDQTEPAQTEPATAEPADTDTTAVTAEPSQTAPAYVEPAYVESEPVEPVSTDPGETGPVGEVPAEMLPDYGVPGGGDTGGGDPAPDQPAEQPSSPVEADVPQAPAAPVSPEVPEAPSASVLGSGSGRVTTPAGGGQVSWTTVPYRTRITAAATGPSGQPVSATDVEVGTWHDGGIDYAIDGTDGFLVAPAAWRPAIDAAVHTSEAAHGLVPPRGDVAIGDDQLGAEAHWTTT